MWLSDLLVKFFNCYIFDLIASYHWMALWKKTVVSLKFNSFLFIIHLHVLIPKVYSTKLSSRTGVARSGWEALLLQ